MQWLNHDLVKPPVQLGQWCAIISSDRKLRNLITYLYPTIRFSSVMEDMRGGIYITVNIWYSWQAISLIIVEKDIRRQMTSLPHGPLTRYGKLWIVHALGMRRTFYPPLTTKETASERSRHATRHVRHAHGVMHVGIANPRWRKNVPGIHGACATHIFAYLVRGPSWVNNTFVKSPRKALTHCGLVTPYGNINPGQHWLE